MTDLLLAPSPTLTDQVDRRRARVLAALTLVLFVHAAQGIVTLPNVLPPENARLVGPAMYVVALGYAVAYVLARSRAMVFGIHLTIAVQLAVPAVLTVLFGRSHANAVSTAAWMSLGILTANALLAPASVVVVGATSLIVSVVTLVPLGLGPRQLGESITWLVGVTAVVFVYARHRDAIETIRQAELRDRNNTLEHLRATLEERVVERTRALEASRADLEVAYKGLHDNQSMLLQTEKMAAIGRLTAGFAHELSSPLSAVSASMSELAELRNELDVSIGDPRVTVEDFRQIASEMKEVIDLASVASTRAATFVRGIRAHTRTPHSGSRERFEVAAVVNEAAQLIMHAARAARATLAVETPDYPIVLVGIPSRLSQCIINLVSNAIDSVAERTDGNVCVRLTEYADELTLEVVDNGPGIRPSILPCVFQPLFTTKQHGKGTGLGLAIVKDIVEQELRGRVEVASRPGIETKFVLHIPTHQES